MSASYTNLEANCLAHTGMTGEWEWGYGVSVDTPMGVDLTFSVVKGAPLALEAGRLAQLVRALASHARGHWFESSIAHHEGISRGLG